jgi:integrase
LTQHRIESLYDDIAAARPVTANRAHTLLRHFLKWCRLKGYAPTGIDPTDGIDRRQEEPRERYLSADEWQRLDAAITLAEREGVPWVTRSTSKHLPKPGNRKTRIDSAAADAIRLIAYTGARLREILHLKWSEYDRDRGMLRLEKTKSGRSKRVLGAPAIELLERLWDRETAADGVFRSDPLEVPASVYVFPALEDTAKPRADLKRPWAAVTRAAGLDGLRIHDLRHNFASVGIGQGLSLPVIGGLLGHKSTAATARYAHLMDDAARRAAELVGSALR